MSSKPITFGSAAPSPSSRGAAPTGGVGVGPDPALKRRPASRSIADLRSKKPRKTSKIFVPQGKAVTHSFVRQTGTITEIHYRPSKGIDEFVQSVASATPLQIVALERAGVRGSLLKDLARRMGLASSTFYAILGVPKATAEKKSAPGEILTGSSGQAAIGMVKLFGIAQGIVSDSTAEEARKFDAAKWLGQWINRPQPSLGGRKPSELLDTPTGVEVVARLLGSIESGAYQ